MNMQDRLAAALQRLCDDTPTPLRNMKQVDAFGKAMALLTEYEQLTEDEQLNTGINHELPAIIIHMDGGVIQDCAVNTPINIMVIDYDCEGSEDDLVSVDWGEGRSKDAFVHVSINMGESTEPGYVEGRLAKFDESGGKEC